LYNHNKGSNYFDVHVNDVLKLNVIYKRRTAVSIFDIRISVALILQSHEETEEMENTNLCFFGHANMPKG